MSQVWLSDVDASVVPEPLAGSPLVVGTRQGAGQAVTWVPGGDVAALAAFLGTGYAEINGNLFQQQGTSFVLVGALDQKRVVFKPAQGEVKFYLADEFGQQMVVLAEGTVAPAQSEVEPVVVPFDPPSPEVVVPDVGSATDVSATASSTSASNDNNAILMPMNDAILAKTVQTEANADAGLDKPKTDGAT